MGAFSYLNDKKIKIWKVEIVEEKYDVDPGTVVVSDSKNGLVISTIDGAVSVLDIQGENARRMGILDYLRGNNILVGEKFK